MSHTPEQLEKDIRETRTLYAARLAELARLLASSDAAKSLASRSEEFGIEVAVRHEPEAQTLRPELVALQSLSDRLDLLIGERERILGERDPSRSRVFAIHGEELAVSDDLVIETVEPRAMPDPARIAELERRDRKRDRRRDRSR